MPPEVMMALCGLVVGPRARHQPPMPPQQRKQVVTTDAHRLRGHLKQVLQFTGADPWLSQSDVIDPGKHVAIVCRTLPFALGSLIPGLTADPEETTGPADVQSGNAGLREDLPGCFFTRETP